MTNQNDPLALMITKLSNQDMPLLAKTSKLIVSMSSRDETSMSELAWAILKDTSLTSQVLRLANSPFYNRDSRKVSTISRAVLQLGFDAVKSICISSMVIQVLLSGSRRDRVLLEMIRSFHAAVQARSFAAVRGDAGAEQVFVATLLHRIGHIAFWTFGGEATDALDDAMRERPEERPEVLEREILGYRLNELTSGLARQWHLGDLVEMSLRAGESDKQVRSVQIAHLIAVGAEAGWGSRRFKNALEAAGKLLSVSEEEAAKLVKESTEEAILAARDYGLGNYTRLIPVPGEEKTEQGGIAAQPGICHEPDPILQLEVLTELNVLVKGKQFNVNMFLSTLLEGVYRGVGTDRVIFAVMSKDKKFVAGRYGLGLEQAQIDQFRFATVSDAPDVITTVLSEKEALWADGRNGKMNSLITPAVAARMPSQLFFLTPLMVRNKVVGVIYADRGLTSRELDEASFSYFKYMTQAANALLSSAL